MDYDNHLPDPQDPQPGQIRLSGNTEWEIVAVSADTVSARILVQPDPKLLMQKNAGAYFHTATVAGWKLLSLPCREVKPGQTWYNRSSKALLYVASLGNGLAPDTAHVTLSGEGGKSEGLFLVSDLLRNWNLIKEAEVEKAEVSDTSRKAEVGDIYEWIDDANIYSQGLVRGSWVRVSSVTDQSSCALETLDGKRLAGLFRRDGQKTFVLRREVRDSIAAGPCFSNPRRSRAGIFSTKFSCHSTPPAIRGKTSLISSTASTERK